MVYQMFSRILSSTSTGEDELIESIDRAAFKIVSISFKAITK